MTGMTDRRSDLTGMTESWARLTGSAMEAALSANAAALDAFSVAAPGEGGDPESPEDGTADEDTPAPVEDRRPGSVDSVSYEDADWTVEYSLSEDGPAVGDSVAFEKTVSDEDVRQFAAVTGDTNRLHLDDEFAGQTQFGGQIAHGGLVSALISAALARLPGVTVYLSQELAFRGPVDVGDRPRATVEVVEDLGGGRYRLETVVENEGDTVIDGEAVVLIEDAPDAEDDE